MAAGFTQAENAALAVIIREIATTGRCGLPIGAIAARAGVCATSARNAVREARARGILHVEERRVARDRNLPNVLTIISRELALWVRTRARIEGQGGAVKSASGTPNHSFHSDARPASMERDRGSRGEKDGARPRGSEQRPPPNRIGDRRGEAPDRRRIRVKHATRSEQKLSEKYIRD